jgi:ubiquinone/menaquinone biosynthesis C-methylase UbiE
MVNFFRFIKCPDCGSYDLKNDSSSYKILCIKCSMIGSYSKNKKIFDLMPSKPRDVKLNVKQLGIYEYYINQFDKKLENIPVNIKSGWSLMGPNSPNRMQKIYNIFNNIIKDNISNIRSSNSSKKIMIDLSAGSGDYTFANSVNFDYVLHCEIDLDSLVSAEKHAESLGIHNMIFIHYDYLQMPFKSNMFDATLLIDSLEYYGYDNDHHVINESYNILKEGGISILDFHRKRPFKYNKLLYEYNNKDINSVCKSNSQINVIKLSKNTIGRISSLSLTNKYIYLLINWMFFLPPVRSISIMKKIN